MNKTLTTIIITVVVVLAIVALINFKNNPNSIPGIKIEINTPKPIVTNQSANDSKSTILKEKTTIYATIENQGGSGNVIVTFHLTQDGNAYQRENTIYLNSGESKNIDATFDEVKRLGGEITYNVDAAAR